MAASVAWWLEAHIVHHPAIDDFHNFLKKGRGDARTIKFELEHRSTDNLAIFAYSTFEKLTFNCFSRKRFLDETRKKS